MENHILKLEGDLDPKEATEQIIEISERHEKQLELADTVIRIELARRRQASDDRAATPETGTDRR